MARPQAKGLHACIHAGAKLSGATVCRYRHCDVAHAEALLAANRAKYQRALIATDGVFSMDGDSAPLSDLSTLAQRFGAWLLADDAHGLGVIGGGRDSSFTNGTAVDVPLQMGTLSKAVGAYGGYLCASQPVVDLMRTRVRTSIYSTGLPPTAPKGTARLCFAFTAQHPDAEIERLAATERRRLLGSFAP